MSESSVKSGSGYDSGGVRGDDSYSPADREYGLLNTWSVFLSVIVGGVRPMSSLMAWE